MNEVLTSREVATLLVALERLHVNVPLADFPRHLMDAVAGLLPDTVRTFDVIDTRTGAVESQVSQEVANPKQIVALIHQFIRQNPVVPYLQGGGRETVLQPTDFVSQREFRRTALYQECFRPLGIEYQIDVALEIPGCIGGMSISRPGPRNFSGEEKQFIRLLRPHIAMAHANCRRMDRLHRKLPIKGTSSPNDVAAIRARPPQLTTAGLTERESEVCHWLGEAKRDGEIAVILGNQPAHGSETRAKHSPKIRLGNPGGRGSTSGPLESSARRINYGHHPVRRSAQHGIVLTPITSGIKSGTPERGGEKEFSRASSG